MRTHARAFIYQDTYSFCFSLTCTLQYSVFMTQQAPLDLAFLLFTFLRVSKKQAFRLSYEVELGYRMYVIAIHLASQCSIQLKIPDATQER